MSRLDYSIIIPVFNARESIEKCIDSILAQSVLNFQVILIDDGSTDGSSTICDRYALQDDRIRVIHQDNQGVSSARNRGIEEASGEWISFVDADDTVFPCYLSEFDKIEQKADLTYFGCYFKSDDGYDGQFSLPDRLYTSRETIEKCILELKANTVNFGHYGYTWNKFFKTSIIKEHNIRFTLGIFFREDEIFVNDYVAHIDSLATMPHIGYLYYYSHNGLSWKRKTSEYWRLYYEKSKDFLLNLSNEELLRHEYPNVMNACYKAFEGEKDDRKYLCFLDEMLLLVKQYGHLCPRIGLQDYCYSILDYYKVKKAKHRIDILRMKKKIKIMYKKIIGK